MSAIQILELVTFLWLTFWALLSLRSIARGRRDSLLFLFLVFYFYFGVPIFCDFVFGKPNYGEQPGFAIVTNDATTQAIYCLYVCFVPLLWLPFLLSHPSRELSQHAERHGTVYLGILAAFVVLPVVLASFAPDPTVYRDYAVFVGVHDQSGDREYYKFVQSSTFLALMAAAGIISSAARLGRAICLVLPFVGCAIWLNGKRTAFAFAIVLTVYVLWQRRAVSGRRLLFVAFAGAVAIAVLSTVYQATVRDKDTQSLTKSDYYDGLRVDFGRDEHLKFAIYAEIHDEFRILEQRGQSLVFYTTAYVPRALWPQKPFPFSAYYTCAMLGISPRLLGYGVTNCFFDECLANFGWIGLVIAPVILGLVCRFGDSPNEVFISVMTGLVAALLISVELIAFAPLFVFWVVVVLSSKLRFRSTQILARQ